MESLSQTWSHLHHVDALIRWGGYTVLMAVVFAETGLLAGVFLPGDSLLVTAGLIAASDGGLRIGPLLGCLSLAAIAGDSVGYAIGYVLGPRVFTRERSRWLHPDHLAKTRRFYERYGAKTIILARFVPIVRTLAPTLAGAGKMRYRSFFIFNVAGGIGWVAGMTLAGYGLGRSVPGMVDHLHGVIAVVILVSFLPLAREWWLARRSLPAPSQTPPASGEEASMLPAVSSPVSSPLP